MRFRSGLFRRASCLALLSRPVATLRKPRAAQGWHCQHVIEHIAIHRSCQVNLPGDCPMLTSLPEDAFGGSQGLLLTAGK